MFDDQTQPSGSSSRPSHRSQLSAASSAQSIASSRASNKTAGAEEPSRVERAWTPHAPLPAVKGTIGGIDSPRRRHFHAASIGNNTPRNLSPGPYNPTTPAAAAQGSRSPATENQEGADHPPASPRRIPNPNAPVFRADQTVKTCFDSLPFDPTEKEALKSLFLI